jgi:hypothetical protein
MTSTPTLPALSDFQVDGKADQLSYDLSEPSVFSGRNYINLNVAPALFSPPAVTYDLPAVSDQTLYEIGMAMRNGFDSRMQYRGTAFDRYFPDIPDELRGRMFFSGPISLPPNTPDPGRLSDPTNEANYIRLPVAAPPAVDGQESPQPESRLYTGVYLRDGSQCRIDRLSVDLQTLTPSEVLAALVERKRLKIIQDLDGRYSYTFLPVCNPPQPMLALVEHYQLTTFLGSYGAGRTIKTLSLLPGEKATISINTYSRRTETSKQTSSILDSLTSESAEDFQDTVQGEITDKQTSSRSDEWQVEAKVQGKWGTGSASLSGGDAGSINSSREQAARNVTNAVQKHAAKASSRRDVSVEQATETRTESGEESSTLREIQNINVGRTLNFVFRQMNQEYVSLLHLVDVGIAFSNGIPRADRIVPLWKLDSLLQEVIAEPASRETIKNNILRELRYVRDYQDNYKQFYELVAPTIPDPANPSSTLATEPYLRPRLDLRSSYAYQGKSFTVPGILLAATQNVMRTDGVIVDTLLGQSEALDDYSKNIRTAAGQAEGVANDMLAADLSLEQLRQQIITTKATGQADAFATMFPRAATGA